MEGSLFELPILYAVFILSLVSTFFTFWIVWRVEQKLDTSFKFILFAIIVFTLGSTINIFQYYGAVPSGGWKKIMELLFIACFTIGVFEMRSLIRSVEKKKWR